MAKNTQLYPDDFPEDKRGSGVNNTVGNSFDTAIELLKTSTQISAIRQAHGQRINARGIIANQSRLIPSYHTMMPRHTVGTKILGNATLGTTAYVPGANGLQVFSFSNEVFRQSSIKLSKNSRYVAVVGNNSSGKICGGTEEGTGKILDGIDKVNYYPSEAIMASIAKLSQPRSAAVGQIGDANTGIIATGADNFGTLQRSSHLYNHSTDQLTVNNDSLQTARFAPHGGLSSKYAGYVLGGSDGNFGGNLLKSIEKTDYTNPGNFTAIANSLTHSHVVHASFGNENKGYLLGGSNATNPATKWSSDGITGFTFSGETALLLSTKLPYEITCSFGAGSSTAGYIFTGYVGEGFNNSLSNSGILKFRYSDEQPYLIEARLIEGAWDAGAISDYSAGFSYK